MKQENLSLNINNPNLFHNNQIQNQNRISRQSKNSIDINQNPNPNSNSKINISNVFSKPSFNQNINNKAIENEENDKKSK